MSGPPNTDVSELHFPVCCGDQIGMAFATLEYLISVTVDSFIEIYDENTFEYPASFDMSQKAFVAPMSILKSSSKKIAPYSTQKERAPSSVSFKEIYSYNLDQINTPTVTTIDCSSRDTAGSAMSGYTTGSQTSDASSIAATPDRDEYHQDHDDSDLHASGSSDDSTYYDAIMELTPVKIEGVESMCVEAVRLEVAQSLAMVVEEAEEEEPLVEARVTMQVEEVEADSSLEQTAPNLSVINNLQVKYSICGVHSGAAATAKSRRGSAMPFDATFRATFVAEWDNLKFLDWSVAWHQSTELYVTPFSAFAGSSSNVQDAQLLTRIENLQYFSTKDAFLAHIQAHPWLYDKFPRLWERMLLAGWERVDAPHATIEKPSSIYQFGRMTEGFSRVLGVHQFVSMHSVMQYIARFPFLLQDDEAFCATLQRHHWEQSSEKPDSFQWVDSEGVSSWMAVGLIKQHLWVSPHLLVQFYEPAIPVDLLVNAIHLKEQVAAAPERGVSSPLPKGMSNRTSKDRAAELHADLVRYYKKHSKSSYEERFFCTVTEEQLRLENALRDLNWLLNAEETEEDYQSFYFVAPWARVDLQQHLDFERSEARLGSNCFYHLFDIAQLAVKYGPEILLHRVPLEDDALVDVRLNLDKSKMNALIYGATMVGSLFGHFSFTRMLHTTGWTMQTLPETEEEQGEDSFMSKSEAKTLFVPHWAQHLNITPENYQNHTHRIDYFLSEAEVEGHLIDNGNELDKNSTRTYVTEESDREENEIQVVKASAPRAIKTFANGFTFLGDRYLSATHAGSVVSLLVQYPAIAQQVVYFSSILGALREVGWVTRYTYEKTAIMGSDFVYYHIAPWAAYKYTVNANKTISFTDKAKRNVDYFKEGDKQELLEYINNHGFLSADALLEVKSAMPAPTPPLRRQNAPKEVITASSPARPKAAKAVAPPATPPSTEKDRTHLGVVYASGSEDAILAAEINLWKIEDARNPPEDREQIKRFTFVYKHFLKPAGWKTEYHKQTGKKDEYVYVPFWAAAGYKDADLSDLVENVDFFEHRAEVIKYLIKRGFSERRTEDLVSPPAPPSATPSKGLAGKRKFSTSGAPKINPQTARLPAASFDMELDEDPVPIPVKRGKKAVRVEVRAPAAVEKDSYDFLGRSYPTASNAGYVVSLLERYPDITEQVAFFSPIFNALKGVGWVTKFTNEKTLFANYSSFYVAPWALTKFASGAKFKPNFGVFKKDAVQNVDYFKEGDKQELLECINKRGFLAPEDLAEITSEVMEVEAVQEDVHEDSEEESADAEDVTISSPASVSSCDSMDAEVEHLGRTYTERSDSLAHVQLAVLLTTEMNTTELMVYRWGRLFLVLKSVGWRAKCSALKKDCEIFFPPWFDFETRAVKNTSGYFSVQNADGLLVEDVDYFFGKEAVSRYLHKRAFDRRLTEDYVPPPVLPRAAPVAVKSAPRILSAKKVASQKPQALELDGEADEQANKKSKTMAEPLAATVSKILFDVPAPSATKKRHYNEGTAEWRVHVMLTEQHPTIDQQVKYFSPIFNWLKEVGWVTKYTNEKTDVSKYTNYHVAPWALMKFRFDPKSKTVGAILFNEDAVRNVDYFKEGDKHELLEYIYKYGFLSSNHVPAVIVEKQRRAPVVEEARDRNYRLRIEAEAEHLALETKKQSAVKVESINSSSSTSSSSRRTVTTASRSSSAKASSEVAVIPMRHPKDSVRHGDDFFGPGSVELSVLQNISLGMSILGVFSLLQKLGWAYSSVKFGTVPGLDGAYFPPWAFKSVTNKAGVTKLEVDYSMDFKEGQTYFRGKTEAVEYVVRRGFTQRSKNLLKSESYDFDVYPEEKPQPVKSASTAAKTFKAKAVSVPKALNHRVFMGRKYALESPECDLVQQIQDEFRTIEEQLSNFNLIKETLLKLRWQFSTFKFKNAVGSEWKDVIIPVWSGVEVVNNVATIDEDVDENVDYFLSKEQALIFINEKGFEEAAVRVITASAATDSYQIRQRSPERPLYKAMDPSANYDRLASSYSSSPLVGDVKRRRSSGDSDEEEEEVEQVDHRVSRMSSVRRSDSFSGRSSHDIVSLRAGDSDSEAEEEQEDDAAQVTNSAGQMHGKHTSGYYESVRKAQREVHDSSDNFHPLRDLLLGANPNFEKVFKLLEQLTPKWTKRVINAQRDAADLAKLAPISATQSVNVIFLRPNRTLKSAHMIFNEDYFYSRQELVEYLKFMLNVIPLPSEAELKKNSQRGARRDTTPHSAVKVTEAQLIAATNDKKRKADEVVTFSSSSSSLGPDISSLVNVAEDFSAGRTLGECLESAKLALHQDRLNPLLFSSPGSGLSSGYVRQETLTLYETMCDALRTGRGTCAYVWGKTGMGKTLAINSIIAQLRHNRMAALGLSGSLEAPLAAFSGSPLKRTSSTTSTSSDASDSTVNRSSPGVHQPNSSAGASAVDCGFNVVCLNSCKHIFDAIASRLNLYELAGITKASRTTPQKLVLDYFRIKGEPVDASHTAPEESIAASKRSRSVETSKTVPMTVLVLDEINMSNDSEVAQLLQLINTSEHCSVILVATCNNNFSSYMGDKLRKALSSDAVDFRQVLTFAPLDKDKLERILLSRACGLFDAKALNAMAAKGANTGDVRSFLQESFRVLRLGESKLRDGLSAEAFQEALSGPCRPIVTLAMAMTSPVANELMDRVSHLSPLAQLLLVSMLVRRTSEHKNDKYSVSELVAMAWTEAASIGKNTDDISRDTVNRFVEELVGAGLAKKTKSSSSNSSDFKFHVTVPAQVVVEAPHLNGPLKEIMVNFLKNKSRFLTEEGNEE
eukprot:gene24231-30550_t